ncbi:MAG: glycosyltransferase family 2 protein [Blastocatellia bacterium]
MKSDNLPLVSVVTPTYNQAAFLPETIESLLSQDYPRIDYRIIDDGSTDSTREILAEYTGRVTWETQENQGQTPTINKGWKQARGEILTWLNSDDTFLPGAVSKAVEYLMRYPEVGIVFGETVDTLEDGTPIGMFKPKSGFDYEDFVLRCENPIPQPSAFIRRSVIEDVGDLDTYYYYFMDWDFWLRAGLRHRIGYIPERLSTYRLHAHSKTVSQARRAAPELERMYRKFFAREDLPAHIRKLETQAMANMYFTSGGYFMRGGDPESAARVARQAVRCAPQLLLRPNGLHKLSYCTFGSTALYRNSRSAYYQVKALWGALH